MSVGVPCVASRDGSNIGIIEDGVNGYLADSEEEWINKLSDLITTNRARQEMGQAGRKTVEKRFSLQFNAPRLYEVLINTLRKDA